MMSCKEVTEICSAEMERSLKLTERLSLRTHLLLCSGCTNYRRQMKTLRQMMQIYAAGKANIADSANP